MNPLRNPHRTLEIIMFDAWNLVGIGGGSAALTWLAAGQNRRGNTMRLSLDKGGSLVGDVRFLGGGLAALASMYTKGNTSKALKTVAAASALSLVQTEIVRMQQLKAGAQIAPGRWFPSYGANALPGAGNRNYQSSPANAWAGR